MLIPGLLFAGLYLLDHSSPVSATELRSAVVDIALQEYRAYPDGSRSDEYWRVSGLTPPYPADWCGGYVLWALRTAGLIVPSWVPGTGFIWPARLPVTADPKPGDIFYQDQPYQHYGIVTAVDVVAVSTVEGNQPGIEIKTHRLGHPGQEYFSIRPLIDRTING